MKFSPAAIAVLALGAAAIPVDPSLGEVPEGFEMCIAALNCEVYKDTEGNWSFRTIAGKEPGSEWYNSTILTIGPSEKSTTQVVSRANSFNCNGNICTGVWTLQDKVEFGTAKPRDVTDHLWNKCYDFGCNIPEYRIGMQHANNGNVMVLPREVIVRASGTFHPDYRSGLIFGVTEVMGRTQTSVVRSGGGTRTPYWRLEMWQAPARVHIARFKNKMLEGEIFVQLEYARDGGFGCDRIMGALGSAIGTISKYAGPVLGVVAGFCG